MSFNVNVPLGHWLPDSSVSYFINHNNRGMTTQQMSLNGSALANRNLNYSVQQSKASEDKPTVPAWRCNTTVATATSASVMTTAEAVAARASDSRRRYRHAVWRHA
ncbi:fimbria/pilus outer membrane usher protein [Enterobacter hormaechei]